ncbi:unnamed protein product, partial [Dibothriocephalus latus]
MELGETDVLCVLALGRPCPPWDLVNNFAENVKQSVLESEASSAFGAHFSWFSGNSCAYILAPFGNDSLAEVSDSTPQFVCFTARDHTSLE